MTDKKNFNYWVLASSALGLGLIVALATCIGVYAGSQMAQQNQEIEMPSALQLKAASASRGKGLSMATGQISDLVEGLYVLDHITGKLQCWILNSRTGAATGVFTTNVVNDLEVDKTGEPDYVMTTGTFIFDGGRVGNNQPARSVVYVGDGATGNVVIYGFTYDNQAIRKGNPQAGALTVLGKGSARDIAMRDQ